MAKVYYTDSDGTKIVVETQADVPDDATTHREANDTESHTDSRATNVGQWDRVDTSNSQDRSHESHYEAPLIYGEEDDKRLKYDDVEDKGEPIVLSHPVEDVADLDRYAHLEARLHSHNLKKIDDPPVPNNGEALFAYAIIDLSELVLDVEDFKIDEISISESLLKSFLLLIAKGLFQQDREIDRFKNYLNTEEYGVSEALGVKRYIDQGSFSMKLFQAKSKLSDKQIDQFKRAAKRAVYSSFRNGIILSENTLEYYNLDRLDLETPDQLEQFEYRIDKSQIAREYQRDELRERVRFLAEETIEPLTFGRESFTYSILDFLGIFATAAMINGGTGAATNVADWVYDRDFLPCYNLAYQHIHNKLTTDDGITTYTEKQEVATENPSIEEQFSQVHQNMFELADRFDFFDDPQTLAVDNICFGTERQNIEDTISRPPIPGTDMSEEWTFTVVSVVNSNSRFTFGSKLITQKDQGSEAARELIDNISDKIDIHRIRADSGMASEDFISLFRNLVGNRWIIRAPRKNNLKDLSKVTPNNRASFVENYKWGFSGDKNPNVVAYPLPYNNESDDQKSEYYTKTPIEFDYNTLDRDNVFKLLVGDEIDLDQVSLDQEITEEEDDKADIHKFGADFDDLASMRISKSSITHALYFVDRTVPETTPSWIHSEYSDRWAIESTMNQLRNSFMPFTGSEKSEHRIYNMNLAILFQNWYTFIHRTRSMELGLRLTPSPQELLKAIQDVAVEKHKERMEEG